MRISRVHTAARLESDQEIRLDAQAGHYVFRVLKLRSGDPLVVFNGDGFDYAAELLNNRRDRVDLLIKARLPAVPEPALRITLVQSVGKGDRMDYSLQKATELGVAAFQPLFSNRTEVRLDEKRLGKRMAHWQRVVISACEQCGRAVVPEIAAATSLDDWLAGDIRGHLLVLDPGAGQSLAAYDPGGDEVVLVIGPEGGFSEREMKQFQLAGATFLGLGPRVLRTETAGPAAITVLQAMHGDLR